MKMRWVLFLQPVEYKQPRSG